MRVLPYDVLDYLCDYVEDRPTLHALSRCSHQLRQITLPRLFRDVVSTASGSWEDAEVGIISLLSNTNGVVTFIRSFRINVYVPDERYWFGLRKYKASPCWDFPSQLCHAIKSMVNLTSLAFVLPEENMDLFQEAFAGSQFPSITHLSLSPYSDFLVSNCPSLPVVETDSFVWLHSKRGGPVERGHTRKLFSAIADKNLQCLSVKEWWKVNLVEALYRANPELPAFYMLGGRFSDSLYECIPILAKFSNLSHLRLAGAGNLGVGFDPPMCGNAYDSPEVVERVRQRRLAAEGRVAWAVAMACPKLERLDFETWTTYRVVRDERGQVVDIVRV